MKYWASRKGKSVGPYPTREAALDAFRAAYPFIGPAYMAGAARNQITTGAGEFGPHFDIRWHDAAELESAP